MKSMMLRYSAMAYAIVACIAMLGASPAARADTIYNVNYSFIGHLGGGAENHITGRIITDGTLGPLSPENILSWTTTNTVTSCFFSCFSNPSTVSSDTGGPTPTWTPGSLTASTGLTFDFGPGFTSSLQIGWIGFRGGCDGLGGCGTMLGSANYFTENRFQTLSWFSESVPAPIVGAGLPGLVLAALGLFGWWRRRKTIPAA